MKSNCRIIRREKGTKLNLKENHSDLVDEIALRDEILELKRQVVILKRTNEQNLIKFRKYEDEAKRKDRQIEELMDPRKNADITKLLSVKGAAILMNLKDQNNSLIQMILSKDLQIKRLVAEIKTSKLYGSSKKTENYRTEINRLRNLLEKSRESLKESINLQKQQQQQLQQNFVSIDGISTIQMSSSSEQSSPRELEDLRFTIQSLETYIKHSNDLLAKKNLEILTLHDELNSLRNISQCKTCYRISKLNYNNGNFQLINKVKAVESPNSHRLKNTMKSEKTIYSPSNAEIEQQFSELFEKTMKLAEDKKKSNSAPPFSLRCSSFSDQIYGQENKNNHNADFKNENEIFLRKPNFLENSEKKGEKKRQNKMVCDMYLQNDVANKIKKKKKSSKKRKQKWIKPFVATKQFKRKHSRKSANHKKGREKMQSQVYKKKEEILDLELEKMKNEVEENYKEKQKSFKEKESDEISHPTFVKLDVTEFQKNNDNLYYETQEKIKENTHLHPSKILRSSENNCKTSFKEYQIQNKCLECHGKKKMEEAEKETEDDATNFIKKEITNISNNFSSEIQRELKNLYENITIYEEIEMKKVKTHREIYEQNFDSSFDSDNGYSSKQEPQSLQVEVEINSFLFPAKNFQIPKIPVKNSNLQEILTIAKSTDENDFSDDDDVIIR